MRQIHAIMVDKKKKMKIVLDGQEVLIGGIIDVDDESTRSELTWLDDSRHKRSQELFDGIKSCKPSKHAKGKEQCLHPFSSTNNLDTKQQTECMPGIRSDAGHNDVGSRPRRRSTLVASESALSASWFASQGMMSDRSVEEYKKELEQDIIREASCKNLRMLSKEGDVSSTQDEFHHGDHPKWDPTNHRLSTDTLPRSNMKNTFKTNADNNHQVSKALKAPNLDRDESSTMWTCMSNLSKKSPVDAVVTEDDLRFLTSQESISLGSSSEKVVVGMNETSDSQSQLTPTRCSSPPPHSQDAFFSSQIDFSARNWSSTLSAAEMADLDGPPMKPDCGDLLAEGIEHLSMAMLVNIYGKLRELSLLGHVSVKLRDIDVNSHQHNSRKKELKRLGCWTEVDEAKKMLDTTRTAGFIVRTVMDETELFEADHARGADNGIKHTLLAYDASLLNDFQIWVEESRTKQLDNATESIINKIRDECFERQMTRQEMLSSNPMGETNASLRIAERRKSLTSLSRSFQCSPWMKQERKLIEDHFGVKNGLPPSRRPANHKARLPFKLSGSLISKVIDESSDNFFEEGSVMRNLLSSGCEVVWFADRHPSDIIYGICVNRQTATITVVFRGQEGILDLFRNVKMSSFQNPIAHEDYDGNSERITLRSAVANDLLRVRMDTKMSLISEIREKIVLIGHELTKGTGYHLSVVGHSRGGGYAAILGYYLASDMYLKLASAVRVFTFASPPVGSASFQHGFKYLEEEGRLMHARFANSNDLFTSLPLRGYCEETKSSVKYHHVGMQIRLHKASEAGRRRIKQSLDVRYYEKEPLFIEVARAARNILSLIWAVLCFQCARNYCISQYHLRMHFAREYRLALGRNGSLRFDRKRKCLKTLNEYYVMKCRRVHDYVGHYDRSNHVPGWVLFSLVACLLYVQIDIFFKFSALLRV